MTLERAVKEGRSGVYRLDPGKVEEAATLAREAGLALHRVGFAKAGTKPAILEALARELRFPEWFGGNWDALQDALCDLSWLPTRRGLVLVVEAPSAAGAAGPDAPEALATLVDVLRSAATYWRGEKRPFLALVTGSSSPRLPALR